MSGLGDNLKISETFDQLSTFQIQIKLLINHTGKLLVNSIISFNFIMSNSKNNKMLQLSVKDMNDHVMKLQSRCKNLNLYIAAFDKDWLNIKAYYLSGGQDLEPIVLELLCMLVFVKLEILLRQTHFIHYGVKSMTCHKNDKEALYVPDVRINNILKDKKYYSSISIEFIASQFVDHRRGSSDDNKELEFEGIRDEFQKLFVYVNNKLLTEIDVDFKRIPALRNAFSQGRKLI